MAELPRYNKRGIMYADLPRIQGIDDVALKETARLHQNIGDKIDSLLSIVDKEGTKYAQEQAIKYVAENPVTQEQIDEAISESKTEKSWYSALTSNNVYENTLRTAQGTMLANQLSVDAQKKFNELKLLSEAGQVDYETAQAEMADIIDGYSATIAAFDPEVSIKARASMATAANSNLQAIGDIQVKAAQAAIQFQLNEGIDTFQRTAEDMAYVGDTFDPATGQTITAEERIRVAADPVLKQALATGNYKMVETIRTRMNDAIINGITKGVLDDSFASSKSAAYARLNSGDLGKYQGTWDAMTDKERGEVKTKFLKEVANQKNLKDDNKEVEKDILMKRAYLLQDEALTADATRRKEIRNELWDINAELGTKFTTDKMLEDIRTGDFTSGSGDDPIMFELEGRIDRMELSDEELSSLAGNGEISYKQARTLQNRKKTVENAEIRKALNNVANDLKTEKPPFMRDSQFAPQVSAAKQELIDRTAEGENPNAVRLDIRNKFRQQQDEATAQAAVKKIASALSRTSVYGGLEDWQLDSAVVMLMENPEMLDQMDIPEDIKRVIKRTLDQLQ